MFIVQASEKNRLKPHRGGIKLPGAAHAAPTGLKRIAGRGVAINMSPRWGLVQAGQCTSRPNKRAGVDAGCAVLFALGRPWPGTTQHERSTKVLA
jgi:hypothetical protein